MDRVQTKWSKEADRALSEKASATRMLWPANRGTLTEGRNQLKREKRAQHRAAREAAVTFSSAPRAPKLKRYA